MLRWKFGGTMGDNATDKMKRLSVVEVEASRIQSSLLYVTRLLTATMRSLAIACDHIRSQAIASDRMRSHVISKKNLSFTTVRVLENASGTRSGTESLPKVFLHDNCEQISFIIFFAFLKKEEMRSGTHFTQQNMFLLYTVVVTKHVWPYFQSRFPKSSSEHVSSRMEKSALLAKLVLFEESDVFVLELDSLLRVVPSSFDGVFAYTE
jgi:hypothetical protein